MKGSTLPAMSNKEIAQWLRSLAPTTTERIATIQDLIDHRVADEMSPEDLEICEAALKALQGVLLDEQTYRAAPPDQTDPLAASGGIPSVVPEASPTDPPPDEGSGDTLEGAIQRLNAQTVRAVRLSARPSHTDENECPDFALFNEEALAAAYGYRPDQLPG